MPVDLFGLGFGISCVMIPCALIAGAWSSYLKKSSPPKRVRYLGNVFCGVLFLLIFVGVFGKWILEDSLISAAQSGDTARVELILRTGIDVNLTEEDSNLTLLMLAASAGHTDTVSALLRHHVDVNRSAQEGVTQGATTALQLAREKGNSEIVYLLEAAGAHESP